MAALTAPGGLWPIVDVTTFLLVVTSGGPFARGNVTNPGWMRFVFPPVTAQPTMPAQTRYPAAP